MDMLLNIVGYGIIAGVLIGVLYFFIKVLMVGLDALIKNDD